MQGLGVQHALQEAMARQATLETQFADIHTLEYVDTTGQDNNYKDNYKQLYNLEQQEPKAGLLD